MKFSSFVEFLAFADVSSTKDLLVQIIKNLSDRYQLDNN